VECGQSEFKYTGSRYSQPAVGTTTWEVALLFGNTLRNVMAFCGQVMQTATRDNSRELPFTRCLHLCDQTQRLLRPPDFPIRCKSPSCAMMLLSMTLRFTCLASISHAHCGSLTSVSIYNIIMLYYFMVATGMRERGRKFLLRAIYCCRWREARSDSAARVC
jgi:hypothetical protein